MLKDFVILSVIFGMVFMIRHFYSLHKNKEGEGSNEFVETGDALTSKHMPELTNSSSVRIKVLPQEYQYGFAIPRDEMRRLQKILAESK